MFVCLSGNREAQTSNQVACCESKGPDLQERVQIMLQCEILVLWYVVQRSNHPLHKKRVLGQVELIPVYLSIFAAAIGDLKVLHVILCLQCKNEWHEAIVGDCHICLQLWATAHAFQTSSQRGSASTCVPVYVQQYTFSVRVFALKQQC